MGKVTILGAGISGLVAAWALEEMGVSFEIVDRGPLDELPRLVRGCVYFHDRCNLPEGEIRNQRIGTMLLPHHWKRPWEKYHQKIWGDRPYVKNSVEGLTQEPRWSVVWSMNDALRFLTKRYRHKMLIGHVPRSLVMEWAQDRRIISTIPLPVLVPDARCEWAPLYIFQSVGGYGREEDDPTYGDIGHVLYNVEPETPWYRLSSMFGYMSMEFSAKMNGWPLTENKKIITSPDAEVFERAHPNIMLTGRWGRWARGMLGHETYHAVKARSWS